MAGWEIALSIGAGWFVGSFLLVAVIGKALRFASAPVGFAPDRSSDPPTMAPELIELGRPWLTDQPVLQLP